MNSPFTSSARSTLQNVCSKTHSSLGLSPLWCQRSFLHPLLLLCRLPLFGCPMLLSWVSGGHCVSTRLSRWWRCLCLLDTWGCSLIWTDFLFWRRFLECWRSSHSYQVCVRYVNVCVCMYVSDLLSWLAFVYSALLPQVWRWRPTTSRNHWRGSPVSLAWRRFFSAS